MPDSIDPRLLAELLEGSIPGSAAPENWNAVYQRGPLMDRDMQGKSNGARIADDMMRETQPYPVNRWLERFNKRMPPEETDRIYDPRTPIY